MQTFLHYFLHLVFPLGIAYVFFRPRWSKTYLVFLLTMLVDLDHLLANPVFLADRCSIGFHPLHSYFAIAIYFILLFKKGWPRIIGLGLLFHMLTDLIDCLYMFAQCRECYIDSPGFTLMQWLFSLFN